MLRYLYMQLSVVNKVCDTGVTIVFTVNSILYFNEVKVATKILRNRLNIAKRSYWLSTIPTFIKGVERLSVTVIYYKRELIAQKLDDNGNHFLYARNFCRKPTSEVSASEQSRCSVSIERAVLVYIRSV